MGLMDAITTGKRPGPRRCLLYGTHGIGKSTWAAQAPNAIFVQTEDGLGDIECAKFPLSQTFDQVVALVGELYKEKHNYKTLVIDSLDWLQSLIWAKVCSKREFNSIEEIGYGKGYIYAIEHWGNLLNGCKKFPGLASLRSARGMTIILVAHARIDRFANPSTESYDRFVPKLQKSAAAVVQEWCDEILFAAYKTYVKKTDEGFDKERAQGIGTGERVIFTTERPAHIAKNRLDLPDELPLEWGAYAKHFSNNTGGKPNGKS